MTTDQPMRERLLIAAAAHMFPSRTSIMEGPLAGLKSQDLRRTNELVDAILTVLMDPDEGMIGAMFRVFADYYDNDFDSPLAVQMSRELLQAALKQVRDGGEDG